jgi:hypothetical protein
MSLYFSETHNPRPLDAMRIPVPEVSFDEVRLQWELMPCLSLG